MEAEQHSQYGPGQGPRASAALPPVTGKSTAGASSPICYDRSTLQSRSTARDDPIHEYPRARRCSGRHAAAARLQLIEIMVVGVILGILVRAVAPNVIRRIDRRRVTKARQDMTAPRDAPSTCTAWTIPLTPPPSRDSRRLVQAATDPQHPQLEAGRLHRRAQEGTPGATTTCTSPPARERDRLVPRRWPTASPAAKDPMPDIGNLNIE